MGKGGGGGSVSRNSIQSAAKYFWQSQPARKAVFNQLESALRTGGGTGFKSGVVHQAIARSQAAGRQALTTAGEATSGLPANLRSRILNRISQRTNESVSRAGPSFANALIGQAPAALQAGAGAQSDALRVAASGEIAGLEAAATRAAGWGNAAATVAGSAGRAIGAYANRDTSAPVVATPQTQAGPWASGYNAPTPQQSWYQRFFGSGA